VLVGAAFAGGASINGPGLAWLQRTFAGGPSIIVDGPQAAAAPKKPKQFPAARTPPLAVDLGPRPASPAKADRPSEPPPPLDGPAAGLAPAPAPAPILPGPDPARLASGPSPVDPAPSLPPLELPPDRPAPAKADPVARLASAVGPDPMPAPSPAPSAPAPSRDWGEIRGRMRTLGVSRYSIEGETEGRVRFSCVIPVDGLRAVGHHFEAEGEDEYRAAEAALRRVALWRATEAK